MIPFAFRVSKGIRGSIEILNFLISGHPNKAGLQSSWNCTYHFFSANILSRKKTIKIPVSKAIEGDLLCLFQIFLSFFLRAELNISVV